MEKIARLEGAWHHPVFVLTFHPWDPHPDGGTLLDAVKALPTRVFDPETKRWIAEGIGLDPRGWLEAAGFAIDMGGFGDIDLAELVDPFAKTSKADPSTILVRPRLAGYDITEKRLGDGAVWDKTRRRFEIRATDLVSPEGRVRKGILLSPAEAKAAAARHVSSFIDESIAHKIAAVADAIDLSDSDDLDGLAGIPDWFGLALYGYQHSGAIAAASGRRLIADPMGLGKTRTALASAAIDDPDRLLIVAPPVALTQWQREATASRVADPDRYDGQTAVVGSSDEVQPGPHVIVIDPRRKVPPFPEKGVVVISDSLLGSRDPLRAEILMWRPEVLIVDEIHRAKTWSSARSKAVRQAAERTSGPRYGISGTPMFAQPAELASPLAVTGQLDPVFGGYGKFMKRYSRKDRYNRYVARKKELPHLHEQLRSQVWVRRKKADVLKDLPAKSRHALLVDVDLSGFRQAHSEVIQTIEEWIDDQTGPDGSLPAEAEVDAFANDSLRLISKLRMAAGLAKIDVAAEIIADWLEQNPADEDTGLWDRPLIVWTHHKVVTRAMAEAVEPFGDAEVIDGSTSQDERTRIVDDFQKGRVPVLVASITAAGVGITLTRSCDAFFIETDWTPALVQQAEDRINRIGQKRPTTITTLVAPGTLDETVQRTLAKKAQILSVVMGDDQDVSVVDAGSTRPAAELLKDMVETALEKRRKKSRTTRKRAA